MRNLLRSLLLDITEIQSELTYTINRVKVFQESIDESLKIETLEKISNTLRDIKTQLQQEINQKIPSVFGEEYLD